VHPKIAFVESLTRSVPRRCVRPFRKHARDLPCAVMHYAYNVIKRKIRTRSRKWWYGENLENIITSSRFTLVCAQWNVFSVEKQLSTVTYFLSAMYFLRKNNCAAPLSMVTPHGTPGSDCDSDQQTRTKT
jgi:hypothetical protein